jgi:hypothetical protein
MAVLTFAELGTTPLTNLLQRFGLSLTTVTDDEAIPGSWFGEPEAGVIRTEVIVRGDTPVHSALHESCHVICMDSDRRAELHTNVGGDYDEENAVCYLQILLADFLPGMGRGRMWRDMDEWGYTFRLGSARAWFEQDAEDARQWLLSHDLIGDDGTPRWRLR